MNREDLDEWRLAERAALEAEAAVRSNIGKRNPSMRDLKTSAARLRAEADALMVVALETKDETLPAGDAGMQSLGSFVAAWRQAEKQAEFAQERLIAAFARFGAHTGPLPPMRWETEVAMLRVEATARLERIYAEAKRLRSPSPEDFRSSLPGSFGER